MDLRMLRGRISSMRKAAIALTVVGAVALVGAGTAGGDRRAAGVSIPAALGVRVPSGWRVLHGWLSDVTDPAPRLAVASFPATLSRHTCECGSPNVVAFPRDGVFVFVWEYLGPFSRRALAHVPDRPAHMGLPGRGDVHQTCDGPSDTFGFKEAGRVLQVEVYLGPRVGAALRAQTAALLDSLRPTPGSQGPLPARTAVSSGSTASTAAAR
jgi:hypothetical protein